jgi:hypothetical protein
MFKNMFSGIKNLSWSLKKSAMLNKDAPSDNRYASYEYFKDKIKKALKDQDMDTFNNILELFLQRISITVSNSIKDDEEKAYISSFLIELGELVVSPIKLFIEKQHVIAHPIEIMLSIIGKEETLNFLDSVLTTEDTLFDDPLVEKRIEILKQFAGSTHESVLTKAIIFINDSDDRLVIAAIRFIRDYVFKNDNLMDKVIELVTGKFVDQETSARIRIELLNVFIAQEWKVKGVKKQFEELLPDGYYINSQGYVRTIKQVKNPS